VEIHQQLRPDLAPLRLQRVDLALLLVASPLQRLQSVHHHVQESRCFVFHLGTVGRACPSDPLWPFFKNAMRDAAFILLCALVGSCVADFESGDVASYAFPPHKMALDDQNYVLTESVTGQDLTDRNDVIESELGVGVHRYNAFWNSFESSGVPSSLECQPGYYQVPADESFLVRNGDRYAKFRCISAGQEALFRQLLQQDRAHGWESAAIIWCAPVYARDPSCLGQPEAAAQSAPADYSTAYGNFSSLQDSLQARIESVTPVLVLPPVDPMNSSGTAAESAFDSSGCSCVPADAYMADYQDFITYLGDAVNSADGRFSHYIVWNECANSFWFDVSPRVDVTKVASSEDQVTWAKIYADLIRMTVAAAQQPALVYASTNRWWG